MTKGGLREEMIIKRDMMKRMTWRDVLRYEKEINWERRRTSSMLLLGIFLGGLVLSWCFLSLGTAIFCTILMLIAAGVPLTAVRVYFRKCPFDGTILVPPLSGPHGTNSDPTTRCPECRKEIVWTKER